MPGNDAVLFFSETRVVEVKEIIMLAVFSADAAGALRRAFRGLRLGNTGGLQEHTGVEMQLQGASAPQQHRMLAQLAALACSAAPNFRVCLDFFF